MSLSCQSSHPLVKCPISIRWQFANCTVVHRSIHSSSLGISGKKARLLGKKYLLVFGQALPKSLDQIRREGEIMSKLRFRNVTSVYMCHR